MTELNEIDEKIAELQAQKEKAIEERRQGIIDAVVDIVAGIRGDDLKHVFEQVASANRVGVNLRIELVKPAKQKAPAKYRDPLNYNKTWSGRGKAPKWFDKEREGVFMIIDDAATDTPAVG